jgi:hypothetical protein
VSVLRPGYAQAMEARPLQSDERALLDFLLTRDFPGQGELVRQAQTLLTDGPSCSCGCPSFSLIADRSLPPAAVAYADRMVAEAHGVDPGGNPVGVLLFLDDGYLSEVEVYGMAGDDFAGLPEPGSLELTEGNSGNIGHLLQP